MAASSRRSFLRLLPVAAAVVSLPEIGQASAQEPNFRNLTVETDLMAPTLCEGDVMRVASATGFVGNSIYVVDTGDGDEVPYRVWRDWGDGGLRIRGDNKRYAENKVSDAWFAANVRGRVVSAIRQIWWEAN